MKVIVKQDDNKIKKRLIDGHLVKYAGKFVLAVEADKEIFDKYEIHAGIELTLVPK